MDKERFLYLLQQYISDNATREEAEELFACLALAESDETLTNFVKERWNDRQLKINYRIIPDADEAWQKMRAKRDVHV